VPVVWVSESPLRGKFMSLPVTVPPVTRKKLLRVLVGTMF
jgi:hypothetical protein